MPPGINKADTGGSGFAGYNYCDDNRPGVVNFINNEWGEIRDITFSCSVDQFMERPKFFAQVDVLSEGGGNELSHYALFIDNLPSVTGGMMVSSQCP